MGTVVVVLGGLVAFGIAARPIAAALQESSARAREQSERALAARERSEDTRREALRRAQEHKERQWRVANITRLRREVREKRRKEQQEKEEAQRWEQQRPQRLARRIAALTLEFEHCPHYEDAQFLEEYARTHTEEILEHQSRIVSEYKQFHHDSEFVALLRQQVPHIYERATWRMRVLPLAERISVKPNRALTPQRRLTEDEVRAIKVRIMRIQAKDEIEQARVKAAAVQEARTVFAGIEDPDERQRLEQELVERILEEQPADRRNKKTKKIL